MTSPKLEIDTIICGDCLQVMSQLPDGCVDLVVADPPFNVNFDYGNEFNDNQSLSEYLDWLVICMAEAERVCKEGRLLFLWQAMLHCLSTWNRFPQARLMAGCKNFVQIRKVDVQWAFDPILFWNKGDSVYEFANKGQMGIRRDWHIGQTCKWVLNKETAWHPCPRPIDTVEYIVGQWSNKDDLIFDPFMGSGTTAVAALKLGRHFYGCDISAEYVKLANERIEKEKTKLEMAQIEMVL